MPEASPTDPGTWGTYTEAAAAVERFGLQGVGVVLTAGDPYAGDDLDTGAVMSSCTTPGATSPLRAITLPAPRPRDPGTWRRAGAAPQPALSAGAGDRPVSTSARSDEAALEAASSAANRAMFCRLFYLRDVSKYPSASEADMALARMLVYWSGDPAQVERIMRSSGLRREKWDTRPSYLGRTIRQAFRYAGQQG
jgi:primase-polymerase (primpol)-like protein